MNFRSISNSAKKIEAHVLGEAILQILDKFFHHQVHWKNILIFGFRM
jgi:hypothetical protein